MKNSVNYFLGANTPNGFYSLFHELYNTRDNWKAYIIKGGPGTGKSGLMKKCVQSADENEQICEQIYCSSDLNSLDGVIFPDLKICIADGTAPHVLEPQFVGAVEELLNIGECWDSAKLFKNSAKIIDVCERNLACHKKCARDLKAISCLTEDNLKLCESFVNTEKVENFAKELADTELPIKKSAVGSIKQRFLNAVTPVGPFCFWCTVSSLADKIIVVEDNSLFVSSKIVDIFKTEALNKGYDIVLCPNPLFPEEKFDHVIIPELKLALVSSTAQYKFIGKCTKKIKLSQFAKAAAFKAVKADFNTTLDLIDALYKRCGETLSTAKDIHDELETYYISSMDFDKVNQKTSDIIKKILG